MLVYTVLSVIFLTKDLISMLESGQAVVKGYEFQLINYYVTGSFVYLVYTAILVALGRLFMKFKEKPVEQSEKLQDSDDETVASKTVELDSLAPETEPKNETESKPEPVAPESPEIETSEPESLASEPVKKSDPE
jgi:cytoskeletal protein RodZ